MKNTMKNKNILSALTGILFVSVLVFGAFAIAPAVHADDDFGVDSGSGCCGGSAPMYDYYDTATPAATPSYDYYDTATPSYDYYDTATPAYTNPTDTYSTPSYSTSGYSAGGYMTGGSYYAPTPVYSTPSYNYPAPIYTNPTASTPTTNNSCTNNSCNTDDHSVVNIQNPAPVINNVVANYGTSNGYQQQSCAQGYTGVYPNCSWNQPVVYQQPVAYNAATPYVSLTQVPYTGLDLGFWGSIAYWGAMILFALVVAYLIAIKRVQNVIASKLKGFLFGTTVEAEEESAVVATPAPVQLAYAAPVKVQTSEDVIDSFIMTQVNRTRRA